MPISAILFPACGLVVLTALVWVWLYVDRLGEMSRKGIDAQKLSTRDATQAALERVNASDNFKNLFEAPVLFYTLCAFLAVTGTVTHGMVTAAWVYVGLRTAHSFVHVTYNRVIHRFVFYVLSTLLLFGMWGVFAWQLLDKT